MRRHPLTAGANVRAQASRLPQIYGQRMQQEYQDKQIGLGEQKLALEERQFSTQKEQFGKQMKLEKEAQQTAKAGMFLKGGLALGKAGISSGMFDSGMDRIKEFGTNLRHGVYTAGVDDHESARMGMRDRGTPTTSGSPSSGPSYGEQFTSGGWKSGAMGGVSGGAMGAGLAGALGAKKKWQTMAAGAAGGLAGSWMAGASDPYSMALGGILGGGLGALL